MPDMKNLFIPTQHNKYKPYLLRKIALVAYSFLIVFVNSFGGIFGISKVEASTITTANIIMLTNQERVANGLGVLTENSQLDAAALAKANNMFEQQYWDHFGPNGETPWQFIRAEGYNYVYAGENLAKGFQTAEGVHEAWMASPTHAANIMSGNYKDIGVAIVNGVLLGKQTTLVVQMFGNLTTEVAGASSSGSPVSSSSGKVVGNEQGEIKSIRITSPVQSSISTDPSINVSGETANVNGEYTIQVYEASDIIGETVAEGNSWEYSKNSDWAEGEHTIKAEVKGQHVISPEITFSIDSTAPVVDLKSIAVTKGEDLYLLTFKIDNTWTDLRIVNGADTIPITSEDKENIAIEIPTKGISTKVVIVASDILGNISQTDITEYFQTDEKSNLVLSIFNSSIGDKISVGIVIMIFILLCIEIFVYWRKGKLKEIAGDLFTVGAWWLILTVAIFNGFTGLIN